MGGLFRNTAATAASARASSDCETACRAAAWPEPCTSAAAPPFTRVLVSSSSARPARGASCGTAGVINYWHCGLKYIISEFFYNNNKTLPEGNMPNSDQNTLLFFCCTLKCIFDTKIHLPKKLGPSVHGYETALGTRHAHSVRLLEEVHTRAAGWTDGRTDPCAGLGCRATPQQVRPPPAHPRQCCSRAALFFCGRCPGSRWQNAACVASARVIPAQPLQRPPPRRGLREQKTRISGPLSSCRVPQAALSSS